MRESTVEAIFARRVKDLGGTSYKFARELREAQARMRRKCSQCPLESSPAGVAKHQRTTGHGGWSNA